MTPFGLRKRLKTALGLGGRAETAVFHVTFVMPGGRERVTEAEDRYTLVMASQTLETPIATECPDGHCGGCAVEVIGGVDALSPAKPAEVEAYTKGQKRAPGASERLACHARVQGEGARVRVKRVWTMETYRGA